MTKNQKLNTKWQVKCFCYHINLKREKGQPGLFLTLADIWFLVTGPSNEKNIFSHVTLDTEIREQMSGPETS